MFATRPIGGRDIAPDDELTCDDGMLNELAPFEPLPEPGAQRTHALPDDLLTYADAWDAIALDALASYDTVPQPLAHLVEPRFAARIRAASEDGVLLDSIRTTYCPPA